MLFDILFVEKLYFVKVVCKYDDLFCFFFFLMMLKGLFGYSYGCLYR